MLPYFCRRNRIQVSFVGWFIVLACVVSPMMAGQEEAKTAPSAENAIEADVQQLDTEMLMGMSLEDVLDVEVSVSTKKAVSIRETPGIVTVISRQEILNSGARDVLEVLTLYVPGTTFFSDVEGVAGIGLRGINGHEGKILLLVDGQEVNEEMFSTTQFGNHYPVETIEKIEVIRGPGSAMYGGYAGVGVINIITRGAEEDGVWVSGLYSQMRKTYSHRNLAFGLGKKADDLSLSLSGVLGQGMRSDRNNVDIVGGERNMANRSNLDIANLNLNVNYKGLDVRAILDRYRLNGFDLWDENYPYGEVDGKFDSYLFGVKYDIKNVAGQNLTISPGIRYKVQFPWNLLVEEWEYTNEKRSEKTTYEVTSIWDVTEKINLVSGAEYYTNYLYVPDTPTEFEETFNNGKSRMGYKNYAGYAQLMVFHDLVNTTIGGRYDKSDEFGSSFTPRIGFTKVWDKLHVKGMYSKSFRVPGGVLPNRVPEGFDDLEPEEADNYEVEVGYLFSDKLMLTMNLFDVKFDNALIYLPDPDTGVGGYVNSGSYGTRGVEAICRYQHEKFNLLLNYAYYQVSDNDVEAYEVPGHDGDFLAFPRHRLNAIADIKVSKKISVHPSVSFFGERYGYAYDPGEGAATSQKFDPTAVFNLNVRARDVFDKEGLEIDFGIRDICDSGFHYIQAYNGGHAPLPSPSRSLYMRVMYKF